MATRLVFDASAICKAMAAAAAAPSLGARSIRAMGDRSVEVYDLDDVIAELGIEEEDVD